MRWPFIFLFLFSLRGAALQEHLHNFADLLQLYEESCNDAVIYSIKLQGKAHRIVIPVALISGVVGGVGEVVFERKCCCSSKPDLALFTGAVCLAGIAGYMVSSHLVKKAVFKSHMIRNFLSSRENVSYEYYYEQSRKKYNSIFSYVVNNMSSEQLDQMHRTLTSNLKRYVLQLIGKNLLIAEKLQTKDHHLKDNDNNKG